MHRARGARTARRARTHTLAPARRGATPNFKPDMKEKGKAKKAEPVGGATPGWNSKPGQGKLATVHDNSR